MGRVVEWGASPSSNFSRRCCCHACQSCFSGAGFSGPTCTQHTASHAACPLCGRADGSGSASIRSNGRCRRCFSGPTCTPRYNAPHAACPFYGRAASGGGSVRSSGGCRSCFTSPTVTPNYNASHAVCPFCGGAAGSGGRSLRSNGGRAYSAFAHVAEPRRLGCRSCGCRVANGTHLRPRASTSDPRYGRVGKVLCFVSFRSQRRYRWSLGWGSIRISRRRYDGKLCESYTSNGENLHAFGGGVLSTSTNRQAQQSFSVSDQPKDLAVFENLRRTPEYQRPRRQSKRHATRSASRGRGRATRGPGEQLWSIAPRQSFCFSWGCGFRRRTCVQMVWSVVKGLLCVCTGVQLLRQTFYTLSSPRGCPSVNVFFVYFALLPLSSPRGARFVFKLFRSPPNPRDLLRRYCWHLNCCVGGGGAVFLLAFFTHNNPGCGRVVKGLLCVCTGVHPLRQTF